MGRAIAKGNRKPGPRPKTLPDGERKAQKALAAAIDSFGEEHPVVQECMGMLLCIARGEPGYRGRYIGDRFRAIVRMLDQIKGKPREIKELSGTVTHRVEIVEKPDGAC